MSDALGGVGYPPVEPRGYISGGRPSGCVLSDGVCWVGGTFWTGGIALGDVVLMTPGGPWG